MIQLFTIQGSAKPSNINRIRIFKSKFLQQNTVPFYVPKHTLHIRVYLFIPIVQDIAKAFKKQYHSRLEYQCSPFVTELSSDSIPGDPNRRLKRNQCHGLKTKKSHQNKPKQFHQQMAFSLNSFSSIIHDKFCS